MAILQKGAEQTKGLKEFIPICAGCHLIRDDEDKDKNKDLIFRFFIN